ncbi:hypothetical protein SAMN02745119_01547 [Trichlorobacter thiogenes]|uniref:Uncharacterized protein n=1 Tax=Trichlorobacter thiogenes TaxID=115783 RepID=A0A1T4NA84_9BACT|nr:hypothetical protein [Trichlorobacter thiogenes]SJZ76200.1 hypothetical protein SAMN02745119_01547 [Trichlorobacter thiogenes]
MNLQHEHDTDQLCGKIEIKNVSSASCEGELFMRIAMLVVFLCCTLFSLVTAYLVINAGQSGSAILFLSFGLLFGCLTGALLQGMRREKITAEAGPVEMKREQTTFVPHWFVMTTLLVTVVMVLGSIFWRVIR